MASLPSLITMRKLVTAVAILFPIAGAAQGTPTVTVCTPHDVVLTASGSSGNPYVDLAAEAVVIGPEGRRLRVPLFWDGGSRWRLRVSPDRAGAWRWTVASADAGLNGRTGEFTAVAGRAAGDLRPMSGHPRHFARQDGSRFWFMGDTAWALFTDSAEERHNRAAAFRYLDARAAQGFNVVHAMVLSEAGWGNAGGPPFYDIAAERLNPAYFEEIDRRVAYANSRGFVVGLAVAWGDKRKVEPYAWRRLPGVEARKRYARYIASRYSAYDVYFLVSGEWHGEVRTRDGESEAAIRREFVDIGTALGAADAHDRMIGIHPMTEHGSVREFNEASWMSFGDYQQNYRDLHARALESRRFAKPVVNSEYGYHLRDQNGDGVPDKDNSTSLESIRHATWDIVMAGAYAVTGFGTTYFGGNRDPGPFDLDAAKNKPWESQFGLIKKLFTGLAWWTLEPRDELVTAGVRRGSDGKHLERLAPPEATYWALATPGQQYIVYVRGRAETVSIHLENGRELRARQFDPRAGSFSELPPPAAGPYRYKPPDRQDWVVVVTRK